MKNMKKIMAVMAVASLVATSGMTAFAYEYEGPQGTVDTSTDLGKEAEANGHTTFSIFEAEEGTDPSNVSFTVPLYVTMAVVGGEKDLYTPSNYEIRNTSDANGSNDPYTISVIGMTFEKLEGSSYNTIEALTDGTTAKDLLLTIGGLTMPALNTATATDVILSSTASDFFVDSAFAKIAPNATLPLIIKGELAAAPATSGDDAMVNVAAVPQFKVKYTVAANVKAADGTDMLLSTYAGDSSVAAGLGVYNVTEGKFEVSTGSTES